MFTRMTQAKNRVKNSPYAAHKFDSVSALLFYKQPSFPHPLPKGEGTSFTIATAIASGRYSLSLWERVRVRDGLSIVLKNCAR